MVLAVLVYLRHTREASWLLVLRLAVVILLAAILLDHVLSFHWQVRPRRVVVLVDRSLSMTFGRADTLARYAARVFPLPPELRKEFWEFGDTARRVPGLGSSPEPDKSDRRTRLGAALGTAVRTRPAAVVLLSDGQDNGGLDPVQVAKSGAVPVYAVGCGTTGLRNVEVVRLDAPPVAHAGDTVAVTGLIRYAGFRGEQVVARVGVRTAQAILGAESAEQELRFKLAFERPGRHLIQFQVDSLPDEFSYADNVSETGIEILPNRTRVAYLTNRPGPQTRFLIDILRKEPRIELLEVIQTGATAARVSDSAEVDVFILDGMYEPGWYSESGYWAVGGIVQRVRQGAGALVLAGPDFVPAAGLTGLLPSAAGVGRRQGSFTPALADAGRAFSWLAGIGFDKVPPFGEVFDPAIDSDAKVWVMAGEPERPVVVAYRTGKGRVVYVSGYPLWRWGFGADVLSGGNSPLSLFVTGVVRYLAEKDRVPFQLSSNKPAYYAGETVRLTLRALSPDGSAWTGLDVAVAIDSGMPVPMRERTTGVYEAEYAALGAGIHAAQAEVSHNNSVLGRAAVSFVVSERELELARTGLDRTLLESVAVASGGQYFRWDSLPAEGFEMARASFRRGLAFEPRRSPWAYVLIAVLLGVELMLRRRRGLV